MWGPKFGRRISRVVVFSNTCGYDLHDGDQSDWNKLFGIMPLSFRGHKWNSYRFVWRHNLLTRKIELGFYYYKAGKLVKGFLKAVHINRPIHCELIQLSNQVHFVIGGISYLHVNGKLPFIGWRLGAYFGGNELAPHEMFMDIYTLKKYKHGYQRTSSEEIRRT